MADTFKTTTCPACGAVMKKIFIPSSGINIDICAEGCGGLFFDNQELQQFNKDDKDISEIKEVLEGKTFKSVDDSQTRICAACGKPMVKTSIKGIGIQIDTCYSCGGVFLDNGELDIIRAGMRRTTVNDLKIQNGQLDENTVKTFYKEMQQEQMTAERCEQLGSLLFGRRSYGMFGFRKPGLIDIIFALLR